MNDPEVKLTLSQVQRYQPCQALLDPAWTCGRCCRPSSRASRPTATSSALRGGTYQLQPPPRCPSLARSPATAGQWFDGSIHFCHARSGAIAAERLRGGEKSP
jgi:hypothetical protein